MASLSDSLSQRVSKRDRRALARVLSLVERSEAPALPEPDSSRPDPATVVGITGSGGSGKSTLIGALIQHLRGQNLRVAVLANDPQSPLSGGALLGDRIRVALDPKDDGIFFRSFSTRGAQGGVSHATQPAIDWLRVFGFDVILVETVGVGQDQLDVRQCVDKLVLVVTPATGDEVQWEKAGVIEVADMIVVNKSDLAGAERVEAQLISALSLAPGQTLPPVLATIATTGQGVDTLWETLTINATGNTADGVRK